MNRSSLLLLALAAPLLVAQTRSVNISVTDPKGRFVTGLDPENFEVLENGLRLPLSNFAPAASPIAIAIVGEGPSDSDLIQATSVPDAIRRLEASSAPRKVLLLTAPADPVADGIEVVQATPADLAKMVIKLRNQYHLEFTPSTQTATIDILLKPPQNLPRLAMIWK